MKLFKILKPEFVNSVEFPSHIVIRITNTKAQIKIFNPFDSLTGILYDQVILVLKAKQKTVLQVKYDISWQCQVTKDNTFYK